MLVAWAVSCLPRLAACLVISVAVDGQRLLRGPQALNRTLARSRLSYTSRDSGAGRHLQAAQRWESIRIHVHTAELEQQVPDQGDLRYLRDDLLQAAVRWFSLAVRVKPVLGSLQFEKHCSLVWEDRKCADISPSYQACGDATIPNEHFKDTKFCQGQYTKCKVSPGGAGIRNADFALYVTALDTPTCTAGQAVGHASVCHQDQMDRPVAGHLNFCKSRVLSRKDWDVGVGLALHEILHTFAFSSILFAFFRDDDGRPRTARDARGAPPTDHGSRHYKPDDGTIFWGRLQDGTPKHYVTLPRVLKAAQQHFGCPSLNGVPLEESGGDGSAFSHWDQRVANTEVMSPHMGDYPRISSMTLALLEDTGWYKPDYSYAGAFNFGRGRGCKFLEESCVKNGVSQFAETFCTMSQVPACGHAGSATTGCTPDRMGKAFCDQCIHHQALPAKFRYFSNPRMGGQNSALAYCPIWRPYLVGNSGALSFCHKESTSGGSADVYGESFGAASRCITSTATRQGYFPPDSPMGSCHEVVCSVGSVRIRVGSDWIECQANEEGDRKEVNRNWRGYVVCPPWAELCGSRGDEGPRAGVPSCVFPAVRRNGRCVCGPGYINDDCSIPDTFENRQKYPFGLQYPQSDLVLTQDVPLDRSAGVYAWPLRPKLVSGPAIRLYSVSPPLPEGLSLSRKDGTLTGTPSKPTSRAPYTIRAAGGNGASTVTLFIVVFCAPETPGCKMQAVPTPAPHVPVDTDRDSGIGEHDGRHGWPNANVTSTNQDGDIHETGNDYANDSPATAWYMRMLLGGVRFRDIQTDPGIDMFSTEFAVAFSSAIHVHLEVTYVYTLDASSLVVEFCEVATGSNTPSLQVAEKLVGVLEQSQSAFRLSEFSLRYLGQVELYVVEDGPTKIWPPLSQEQDDASLFLGIAEWQTWMPYLVVTLFVASFLATCATSKSRQDTNLMRYCTQLETFLVALAMMLLMVLLISELQTRAYLNEDGLDAEDSLVVPEFHFNHLQSLLLCASAGLFVLSLGATSLGCLCASCEQHPISKRRAQVRWSASGMACNMLAVAALITALMMSVWPQLREAGLPWLKQLPEWQRRLLYAASAMFALSFFFGCVGSCRDDQQAESSAAGEQPRAKSSSCWSRLADVVALFAHGAVLLILVEQIRPELRATQESGFDFQRFDWRVWLLLAMILLFVIFAFLVIRDLVRHCRGTQEIRMLQPAPHRAPRISGGEGVHARHSQPAASHQMLASHRTAQIRSLPPPPVVVGVTVDIPDPAPAGAPMSDMNSAMLQMLAMGFDFDTALRALKQHAWDVTRAVDSLPLNDPANRS